MTPVWLTLLAGGLVGAGLVVILAGLAPAHPDLADAVHRLLPADSDLRAQAAETPGGRVGRLKARILPQAVLGLGLARFALDLRTVQVRPEELAAKKIGYALVGLAFPPVMSAVLLLTGIRLPLAVPAAAGLLLGGVFFFLPDLALRQDAANTRAALRAATCVFLELVAMERLADAGPTEALDRAAAIGGSPQFTRIGDALLRAELAGQPSWTGLTDLAAETGVSELADTADIMRLAGRDGAAVYTTLRARAASLRTQLLASSTAQANAASEHMVVPVSLLGLCFMALLGYPALMRILLT
ncbi:type II secretion system F family protein [Cellulomonas sp. SG140]|uniref:type II secretion system F family protein n=1 Tax=Cellulomonas sp. SG140 TaxID=2976536 RepID=UPI0021E93BAB|nr:type II secretion system F family protein [Cellulomonas sp. SG140]